MKTRLLLLAFACCLSLAGWAHGSEALWIEAEDLNGIEGSCWPMADPARPAMKQTNGHFGLSGPGWAAEWIQGGESNFLSIACAGDDDKAVASKDVEIPEAGRYRVWVRYGDWREQPEPFQIRLEQAGGQPWSGQYGLQPVVEEDNEMKLYWNWAFAWDSREVELKKGPAKLTLASVVKAGEPRQIDIIVITNDPNYRPLIKDRPSNDNWSVVAAYRDGQEKAEPLTRRAPDSKLPDAWKVRTFRDKGFLYLWNMANDVPWAGDDAKRVPVPYHMRDEDIRKAFEEKYAGKTDVPIFSDPRIVPTFHAVGPRILQDDAKDEKLAQSAKNFMKWLDANPDRQWATMMNYFPDTPLTSGAMANFDKYRDRYVGGISGENLGYFHMAPKELDEATAQAKTRRAMAEAVTKYCLTQNAAKYRTVYGKEIDNAYQDVISCLSVGMIQFAPMAYQWGARTLGFEATCCTNAMLGMRTAFLRGAARQNQGLFATYRSCNFGDSSTIFSQSGSFSTVKNMLDNYYSVFSGAGMTWYKFDIWYQYMAGSSMFYHEQGFDEYWMPGGTTAAGRHPLQLSPKGKLVDRFLRTTAAAPDRGAPFTPAAILVDYAHNWEPTSHQPNGFLNQHLPPGRISTNTDHYQMMHEYFWTAYYPIGPISQAPITGVNETYIPSAFGDIFDVIYAYPDVSKWTTIDTYPVVILAGEIEMTAAEAKRLAQYIDKGGTVLLTAGQLPAEAAKIVGEPAVGPLQEASSYRWMGDPATRPSQAFRYRAITGGKPLAATEDGQVFCASFDRGQGRLVYLSVPLGMGIDRNAVPAVGHLFANLTAGLMPVQVQGQVEWLVNRSKDGWLITLLNPAGQDKPQQGITATDYRKNQQVVIHANVPISSAGDRLTPSEKFTVKNNQVTVTVPAGGVRVMELK